MKNIKVLIVEDRIIIKRDIESALKKEGFIVTGSFSNGDGVLESISKDEPDVIVMDIDLNQKYTGIDIAKNIHETKNIPIVYLTGKNDDETFQEAFSTDPIGFLVKPFQRDSLKSTIMLGLNKIYQKKSNSYIGKNFYFDTIKAELFYKNKFIKLSTNEKSFLSLLVEANGSPVSKSEVYDKVWNGKEVSDVAMRNLIYRLKEKIDADMVKTVYSYGYQLNKLS